MRLCTETSLGGAGLLAEFTPILLIELIINALTINTNRSISTPSRDVYVRSCTWQNMSTI